MTLETQNFRPSLEKEDEATPLSVAQTIMNIVVTRTPVMGFAEVIRRRLTALPSPGFRPAPRAAAPLAQPHQAPEEKALGSGHKAAEKQDRKACEENKAGETRDRQQAVVEKTRRPDRRWKAAANALHQAIRRADHGDDLLSIHIRGSSGPAQAKLEEEGGGAADPG